MAIHNQGGQITGALQVLNKENDEIFNQEDIELLSAFTSMVGVCLENANAYAELQSERQSLEIKVIERTAELAMAKSETDQILNAVEEGLFLLYQSRDKYIIGAEHSLALASIFETDELRSKNFLHILTRFITKEVVNKTTLFLDLMFKIEKKQSFLLKLNPLNLVEAVFVSSGNMKFLKFKFERVVSNNSIDHLMVTVRDITEEVKLKEKLLESEEKIKREREIIYTILQSEPGTIEEYISGLEHDLESINTALKKGGCKDAGSSIALLTNLFRIVHSIKGNAALLNFSLLAQKANEIETRFGELINSQKAGYADLVEALFLCRSLHPFLMGLKHSLAKIQSFQGQKKATGQFERQLMKVVEKSAAESNKSVDLDFQNFDASLLPASNQKRWKDIVIQVVRNAISHGIEPVAERQLAAKEVTGKIFLSTASEEGGTRLTIEDDGAGMDEKKIAEKAIAMGIITSRQLETMDQSEILRLIFHARLSTSDKATDLSGRGMGMNIIDDALNSMGGSIEIETKRGVFTRFTFHFPGQVE